MRIALYTKGLPVALLIAATASPSYSGIAAPQDVSGMEAVYQSIDSVPKLTLAERYEQKMQALNATLEAGDAYTAAFDDLAAYTEIARSTGSLFTPGFGAKLEEFQTRIEEATKNRAFTTLGKIKLANDYAAKAVGLVSEADAILGDKNLTPSGRRSLVAIKGLGKAMQSFGEKVPGIGKALEVYGQLIDEMTGAVRVSAKNIVDLKGGAFTPSEERDLGLGPGYIRTPLYDQGLDVVQELINEKTAERTRMRTADGTWRDVKYDDVTAIWSEYRFVHGSAPTASEVVQLLDSPDLRGKLNQIARRRVDDKHAEALTSQFGLSGVSGTKFRSVEDGLQESLQRLGLVVPKNSAGFNELLKRRLMDPHGDDALLKRMALTAHPQAREYFAWRGLDPEGMSLEALALKLIEYRVSGSRQFAAHLRTQDAARPPTGQTTGVSEPPKSQAPPKTPPAGMPDDLLKRSNAVDAAARGKATVQACVSKALEDSKLKYAIDVLSTINERTYAFPFYCGGIGADYQRVAPPACCTAYEASKGTSGAWTALQVCGLNDLIEQRRKEYLAAAEACVQKSGKR